MEENEKNKWDAKMKNILNENLARKYKNDKLSYETLLKKTIEYESNHMEYLTKLENNKYEIFKLKQKIIDLESENTELNIHVNNLKNKLYLFSSNITNNFSKTMKKKNDISMIQELSLEDKSSLLSKK
jgi:hypothetical protein